MKANVLAAVAGLIVGLLAFGEDDLPGYLTDPTADWQEQADDGYRTPDHLKYPYVSVHYVTPTLTVGERCRIRWYVTDFDHSLWRFGDSSKRFDVFVRWTKDDAVWDSLVCEDVPSGDGEFDLGVLPAGAYSVGVWCRDRTNGLESHRVWHEFRVVEPGALDIPEEQVRRMTAADLAAYGLRNDGDYERVVLIPSDDPALVNGGRFNLKVAELTAKYRKVVDDYLAEHPHEPPAGRPGYTVYTASFKDQPIDRAYDRKRLVYDPGYDRAAVAAIAETNSVGLQRFVDDAAAAGFRKVVFASGTYRVSHRHTLSVPDGMTLDLGGATLKLDGFDGEGSLMVELAGVTDARLQNGTVEGDYFEHSYETNASVEAVHGWNIGGASRYCVVSNVTTKNITGYGGGNHGGSAGPGPGVAYSLSGANNGFTPGGLAADGTVDADDTAQWTSPYKDISAFKPYRYLVVSKSTGYRGVRTRGWNYVCAFYDANLAFLSRETAFQYRNVRIPPSAAYARFSIEVASEKEATDNDLTLHLEKVPRNCTVVHNVYDRCRCVGHASSDMSNFLFLENEFKYSGEAKATCAYDAEDGWDNMQDVLFLRNNFHDNNRSELLTCCGHNFQIVDNIAKISLAARTFSAYVVSNDAKSASFECTWRTRTGYARYIDNVFRSTLTLGGERSVYADWDVVIQGVTFDANRPPVPTTITGGGTGRFRDCTFVGIANARIPSADNCTFVGCQTGLMRWSTGRWSACAATNCTFTRQWCTNRFVDCTLSGCSFSTLVKSPQSFAGCTLDATTFSKSATPAPEFFDCTGVPSGYPNRRLVHVDRSAAAGGDGTAAHPFRTIAEGVAAATGEQPVVEIAGGTYVVTEPVVVDRIVTLRPAANEQVTVDGKGLCRAFELAHPQAAVEGLRIVRSGLRVDGGATVSGCVIRDCTGRADGIGVDLADGTLMRCLVTGCTQADYGTLRLSRGRVRLVRGRIDRCTIVGDLLSATVLEIANDSACTVRDTIAWGGVSVTGTGALAAAVSGLCAPTAVGIGAVTESPAFADATSGDYRLSPASPCRGVGTDGGDLGCYDFSGATMLGVSAVPFRNDTPVLVTVTLAAGADVPTNGATVVWTANGQTLAETGFSFVRTFAPGSWDLTATVTLTNGTVRTATRTSAVRIGPETTADGDRIVPRVVPVGGTTGFATIAEGLAATFGEGDVVEIAAGTYGLTAPLSVDRAVTVRPAAGASVTVDAAHACRCLTVNHPLATVAGLVIRRGKAATGGGVFFGANGGTLTNCVVEACQCGAAPRLGHGIYLDGGALVTGCTIRDCHAVQNGTEQGVGAYLADGTLERCLVTGCKRGSFADRQTADGAVYLAKGLVNRCTIAGNAVTHATLHVADRPTCAVRDTIVWGNKTRRDSSAGRPNVNDIGVNAIVSGLCTTVPVGLGPISSDPSFVDAAHGDYRLSPASPCRGAGTDGCDLGYLDYETRDALGIAVSAVRGTGSLTATVSLVADGAKTLSGASVAWKLNGTPIAATGTSFEHVFAPGRWDLSADVTFADTTTASVTLPGAVEVRYAGTVNVSTSAALNEALELAGNGLELVVAEGDYELTRPHELLDGVRLVGAGDRFRTVLRRTSSPSGRVLYLNNEQAFVANVTLTGGETDREGGGVWIDTRGGTLSNCVVSANKAGTNAGGGGVWMNSPKAVVSHSLISSNVACGAAPGGGVLLSQGTLADCLVVSNHMNYSDRSASVGGGVCMDTATADALVLNCTIARNKGSSGCGLYRKANAGRVVNTLIYDNVQCGDAVLATPNWASVDGATRPTASSFVNCCSDVAVGVSPQVVSAVPYDAAYRLTGDAALACVDKGATAEVFSSVDYDGAERILGKDVDIGAIECTTIELDVIHVDGAAAAGGDGSRAHPFQTVADGIAAARDGVDTVKVASGTYAIAAALSVTKAITIRPERGATVTIDANGKCRCLSIDNADAVVEGLRLYRGKVNGNGAGVLFGTAGGTLRDCTIDSCKCSGSDNKGPAAYLNSSAARVSGCRVLGCGTDGFNGHYECHGVYLDNGTLDHTLVAHCKSTSTYADGKRGTAAVYLAKGTVRNCTIVDNTVSAYALYCANAATCRVVDTISWGNVSLRGVGANVPNANDIGAGAQVENLFLACPAFADTVDYALAPGSPCIGAGTDGGDIGWKAFDGTATAVGIRTSVSSGTAPLSVDVALVPSNVSLDGATVVWEGLDETGTSFTHTFGGGVHTLRATVTLANGTVLHAESRDAVTAAYAAGTYDVSTAAGLEAMLASPLEDGVVIRVADGTYDILGACYPIRSGVRIVGASREGTVLRKKGTAAGGRFFYVNHAEAELANLTLFRGAAGCSAGGVWIDGRGGTVSNCAIRSCSTGASQAGGGVWMNSADALVTHSIVSANTVGQNTYCGGVLLSQGTLANSLVISNTAQYYNRTQVLGAGVYMDTSTENAKVVNCTIARNKGYRSSGLYRKAGAGYVSNTIVYDNISDNHEVDDNFVSADGKTRPVATAIRNCCSTAALGTAPQTAAACPYDPVTYVPVAGAGAVCIDKGDNAEAYGETDFLGKARIFNGIVDIGAIEYAATKVEVGILASAKEGVGPTDITLTASVTGAKPEDCAYAWYLDGSDAVAGEAAELTKTFAVGLHGVRLVVVVNGVSYADEQPAGFIKVYSPDVHVDANSSVEPVWPYTQDTPATNLSDAATAFVRGVTLHIAEGRYPMKSRFDVGPEQHVVGAGWQNTVLYHPTRGAAGFRLTSPSATVDALCVSNSAAGNGGGFYIQAGTVTGCKVTHCEADTNQDGGGVNVAGTEALFDRGIVTDCTRWQWNGQNMAAGGGVAVTGGGRLRNTLVTRCRSNNGGGVILANGTVENCTIVSNCCDATGSGVGGLSVGTEGTARNNIVWGNVDADAPNPDSARHNLAGTATKSSNNCSPVAFGTAAVTYDPLFKDAAAGDCRIGAGSPCAYSGIYRTWMDGATDFFGQPRMTPSKKVSIGFCQAPAPGLLLFVR